MADYKLPEISSYGQYSSDNYGAHSLRVEIPNVGEFFFSYQTVVAFRTPKTGLVVSENDWGRTTGKHLNWLDRGRKERRVPREKFEAQLAELLEQ